MKKIYVIPNIVTAFGLACGLFVIFRTSLGYPYKELYHELHISALLLLLTALSDFLDGAIARLIKAESDFGGMFDSLADAISFGVAPSVLFLKAIPYDVVNPVSFITLLSAMLFTICGVLRLVRFNVQSHDQTSDPNELEALKRFFIGFPIPAAAGTAVSMNLFLNSPLEAEFIGFSPTIKALILSVAMMVLGVLMICRIRFPSLKSLHVRVPSLPLVIWSVIAAISILYGILYFFPAFFMGVSLGYLILGLVLALKRKFYGEEEIPK